VKVPRGAGTESDRQFFARFVLNTVDTVAISVLGFGIDGRGHKILERSESEGKAVEGGGDVSDGLILGAVEAGVLASWSFACPSRGRFRYPGGNRGLFKSESGFRLSMSFNLAT